MIALLLDGKLARSAIDDTLVVNCSLLSVIREFSKSQGSHSKSNHADNFNLFSKPALA